MFESFPNSFEWNITDSKQSKINCREVASTAPGEGQKPLPDLIEKIWQELPRPHLFPTGQFCYKVKRQIPLSAVESFNFNLTVNTKNCIRLGLPEAFNSVNSFKSTP